jgi:hypothetical protein
MKKFAAVSLILSLLAIALVTNARTVNSEIPAPPEIGATIVDFTLPDASGVSHSLASLEGKNGTVLIFIAVQCPVSNAYNERMEKLAKDYKARGINVIGINSNYTESAADVKDHAAKNNLTFPIVITAASTTVVMPRKWSATNCAMHLMPCSQTRPLRRRPQTRSVALSRDRRRRPNV